MSDCDERMQTKPRLNRRFRLQWEPARDCHVLLYPEGMVQLNPSAVEILRCCDGANTVDDIITTLEALFSTTHLRPQVEDFLKNAFDNNWIQ